MGNIGIYGVEAGPKIFVADYLSLANPIGSRLDEKLGPDSRIGHSQLVPLAWYLARYAAPSATDKPAVQNARTALQCGALARLDEDLTAPMTPGRFFHSILDAKKMTVLRIPMDPAAARARFCNSRPHR
jgi:arabinofuranosyltransferase